MDDAHEFPVEDDVPYEPAAHFLTRVDRLQGAELDRAMRLYYHRDELRRVVAAAVARADPPPPPDHDVAIALGEGTAASRVIVSQVGALITCLRADMACERVLPVSWAEFDAALQRRAALDASLRDRAAIEARYSYSDVFRTLNQMGQYLPREHVDWLMAHGRIVGWVFAHGLDRDRREIDAAQGRVCIARREDAKTRLALWRRTWALCFKMLVCAELGEFGAWEPLVQALWRSTAQNATFAALAVAKLAPRWPGFIRGAVRGSKGEPAWLRARLMVSVACCGLAHPGRRDQARTLLGSLTRPDAAPPALARLAAVLLDGMDRAPRVPLDEGAVDLPDDVPEPPYFDMKWVEYVLVGATRPLREWQESLDVSVTKYKADVKEMEAQGEERWRGRPTVRVDAPTPGRNDACACGSGRKFKRCCGA